MELTRSPFLHAPGLCPRTLTSTCNAIRYAASLRSDTALDTDIGLAYYDLTHNRYPERSHAPKELEPVRKAPPRSR